MKGLDISSWQKGLGLKAVANAGYKFVILRGGYTTWGDGVTKKKDTTFEGFYNSAKQLGLAVGAYYYSCANSREKGIAEAQFLYENCLKGKQFEMPIYIDVEDSHWQAKTKSGTTDAIIGFCETLENLGYFVGVYANLDWFRNRIEFERIKQYSRWLAFWTKNKPSVGFSYGMWQNSNSGAVGGFRVDTNEAYDDFVTVIKNKGLNGFKAVDNGGDSLSAFTDEQLADKVLAGEFGNGNERKSALGSRYDAVQKVVNEKLSVNKKKSIGEIAQEVIDGKWGDGWSRKNALTQAGYDFDAVQKRVNEIMHDKDVEKVARDVIAGKYGNTPERKKALKAKGYDYAEVQKKVNELLS